MNHENFSSLFILYPRELILSNPTFLNNFFPFPRHPPSHSLCNDTAENSNTLIFAKQSYVAWKSRNQNRASNTQILRRFRILLCLTRLEILPCKRSA